MNYYLSQRLFNCNIAYFNDSTGIAISAEM